jgi:multisubunit Na+/H+ antiporter MnhB subunit
VLIPLVGGGVATGYAIAGSASKQPVLLARLDPTTRGIFYGSVAGSPGAGALLGLIIASLAILLTLDDARKSVKEMQTISAWRMLNMTLLVAAGCLAVTLALATIALGVDSRVAPNSDLEVAVVAVACLAFSELLIGGLAFAIVVLNIARRPQRQKQLEEKKKKQAAGAPESSGA